MQLQFRIFQNYLVMLLQFFPESILHKYSVEGIYTCYRESSRKDTTTFEMELCGCKQATAHAHVQSRCMWLNFEHTRNSNRSKKKKAATTKIEFESADNFHKKKTKSVEFISGGKVL